MSPERQPAANLRSLLPRAVLAAAGAWLAVETVLLAVVAEFGLDEFQYAHGGWLIARGEVIYRDFFEHHLPLLHQLLAGVWLFLADDPTHLLTLRLAFLPVFALSVAAAASLNRDEALGPWITVPVLLAVPTLSAMAIQLRPDVLGAALFLASLAVLRSGRRPRLRGVLAGALAVLALWATLKVAIYGGLIFLPALVADLWTKRHEKDGKDDALLGHPLAFVAGSAAVAAAILVQLLLTGSLGDAWRWCIAFSFEHQRLYPGFAWTDNFLQLLDHSLWLLPAATAGATSTVRGLRRGERPAADVLLLAALATTLASFVWQTAPYLYSLVPFTFVLGLFAARGLSAAVSWMGERASTGSGRRMAVFTGVLLLLFGAFELRQGLRGLERLGERTNEAQLETLARLGEITDPGDPVFHQWAGQVARPPAHFFHFLEAATKIAEAERLAEELVPAMIEKGVSVYYYHRLFPRLPENLQAYLLERFVPMTEDLWIYGSRYEAAGGRAEGTFHAVVDGTYFVTPLESLENGTLRLEGRPVNRPVLRLRRGSYAVEYEGGGEEIYLLWLPRDGTPFEPRPDLKPESRRPPAQHR